jgi:hypothetical protein
MLRFNPTTGNFDYIRSIPFLDGRYINTTGDTMTGSLLVGTDSLYDLGSSSKYWANGYIDRVYLNSTANIDGSTAGSIKVNAQMQVNNWYTAIQINNEAPDQYSTATVDCKHTVSSFGDYGGIRFGVTATDVGMTQNIFAISRISYAGVWKTHLLDIDLNNNKTQFYTPEVSLIGTAPKITTASNNNLSLIPNGTGYTIIGNAGTTSHTLNTNDDLLVSGRLEVDGSSYFDGADNIFKNNVKSGYFFLTDTSGNTYLSFRISADDGTMFAVTGNTYANNNFIFSNYDNRNSDHDHDTLSANPTIFIHSQTDPDTVNTQWLSLTHDQTDGVIATGTGDLKITSIVNLTESLEVDGVKVVGNRVVDARADDVANSGDATTDGLIDALRDAMIAHGLIAAS